MHGNAIRYGTYCHFEIDGQRILDVQDHVRPDELLESGLFLWVAKTSTATKNETVLGREGLNTILASTQREDFGGQEPVWAYSTHTH